MQVQPDISSKTSIGVSVVTDEIVGMPDDCVSVESFFSTLREAVKDHYENL